MADAGVQATQFLLDDLKRRVKEAKATEPAAVKSLLADAVAELLAPLQRPGVLPLRALAQAGLGVAQHRQEGHGDHEHGEGAAAARGPRPLGGEEAVDGDYQDFKSKNGAYVREHFWGADQRLLDMVKHLSDDQVKKLTLGGHDPVKVYNAYKRAVETKGQPTVILAKTVKGYGLGEAGEGRNVTHQQKKLNEKELREFRARETILSAGALYLFIVHMTTTDNPFREWIGAQIRGEARFVHHVVGQVQAQALRRELHEELGIAIGTVHPFSSHSYQLRLFAERGVRMPRRFFSAMQPPRGRAARAAPSSAPCPAR